MKIKYLIFALLFVIVGYSQALIVNYSEKRIISKERLASIPEFAKKQALESRNYILQYNNGMSFYRNSLVTKNVDSYEKIISDDQIDGEVVKKSETSYNINVKTIEKWYYKDFNKNELLFNFYNGKDFYGKDSLLKWNWQITNETKEINGFTCKKATSDAFGYYFTAWFTEDIAVSAGPEKFDGLPGLILYIGTPYYEYVATNINVEKNPITIIRPEMPKETVTMAEVENYAKVEISKLKSSSTTTVSGNSTTTRTTTIIK